eukprot:PhF_6_TR40771/c0_g1_i3/m.61492
MYIAKYDSTTNTYTLTSSSTNPTTDRPPYQRTNTVPPTLLLNDSIHTPSRLGHPGPGDYNFDSPYFRTQKNQHVFGKSTRFEDSPQKGQQHHRCQSSSQNVVHVHVDQSIVVTSSSAPVAAPKVNTNHTPRPQLQHPSSWNSSTAVESSKSPFLTRTHHREFDFLSNVSDRSPREYQLYQRALGFAGGGSGLDDNRENTTPKRRPLAPRLSPSRTGGVVQQPQFDTFAENVSSGSGKGKKIPQQRKDTRHLIKTDPNDQTSNVNSKYHQTAVNEAANSQQRSLPQSPGGTSRPGVRIGHQEHAILQSNDGRNRIDTSRVGAGVQSGHMIGGSSTVNPGRLRSGGGDKSPNTTARFDMQTNGVGGSRMYDIDKSPNSWASRPEAVIHRTSYGNSAAPHSRYPPVNPTIQVGGSRTYDIQNDITMGKSRLGPQNTETNGSRMYNIDKSPNSRASRPGAVIHRTSNDNMTQSKNVPGGSKMHAPGTPGTSSLSQGGGGNVSMLSRHSHSVKPQIQQGGSRMHDNETFSGDPRIQIHNKEGGGGGGVTRPQLRYDGTLGQTVGSSQQVQQTQGTRIYDIEKSPHSKVPPQHIHSKDKLQGTTVGSSARIHDIGKPQTNNKDSIRSSMYHVEDNPIHPPRSEPRGKVNPQEPTMYHIDPLLMTHEEDNRKHVPHRNHTLGKQIQSRQSGLPYNNTRNISPDRTPDNNVPVVSAHLELTPQDDDEDSKPRKTPPPRPTSRPLVAPEVKYYPSSIQHPPRSHNNYDHGNNSYDDDQDEYDAESEAAMQAEHGAATAPKPNIAAAHHGVGGGITQTSLHRPTPPVSVPAAAWGTVPPQSPGTTTTTAAIRFETDDGHTFQLNPNDSTLEFSQVTEKTPPKQQQKRKQQKDEYFQFVSQIAAGGGGPQDTRRVQVSNSPSGIVGGSSSKKKKPLIPHLSRKQNGKVMLSDFPSPGPGEYETPVRGKSSQAFSFGLS